MKTKYIAPHIKTRVMQGQNSLMQSSIKVSATPTNVVYTKEKTSWEVSNHSPWDEETMEEE